MLHWGMRSPPKLSHRKKRDYWCVVYRGKETYLGKDESESREKYFRWISEVWSADQSLLAEHRRKKASAQHAISVSDLRERFLASVEAERQNRMVRDYRYCLNHLSPLDNTPAQSIRPVTLEGIKRSLADKNLKPTTINHIIGATKTMLRWAARHDLVEPVDLSSVRQVRVAKKVLKVPGIEAVQASLTEAQQKDPRLEPWIALNYLAAMRPSEVARMAAGEYEWYDHGIAVMQGKSTWKRDELRYILLSEEALVWLPLLQPHWQTWESYSKRVSKMTKLPGPRVLRSWAASHLRRIGVGRGDIERALGHSTSGRQLWEYMEEDLPQVRAEVSRLSLQSPSDRLCGLPARKRT